MSEYIRALSSSGIRVHNNRISKADLAKAVEVLSGYGDVEGDEPGQKDIDRLKGILDKSKGDPEKAKKLAQNVAKTIKEADKAIRRAKAAKLVFQGKLAEEIYDIFMEAASQQPEKAAAAVDPALSKAYLSKLYKKHDDLFEEIKEKMEGVIETLDWYDDMIDKITMLKKIAKDIEKIEMSVSVSEASDAKTEEDFDKLYTYDSSIISEVFDPESQAGMLETYGADLKKVLEISKKHPKRVWTMIDGDEGMYLVQGYHLVNRIYYVITKEEAKSEDEEYLFDSYESEE